MLPYDDILTDGAPYPLGATFDGLGCNFAIYSSVARAVYLCLFDNVTDKQESMRIPLPRKTNHVFHGHLRNVRPGQLYSFRVDGVWDPENGLRCNASKLCLDPYAKGIARSINYDASMFSHVAQPAERRDDMVKDESDNAAFAPLSMVIDDAFSWGVDRPPRIPFHKTVIYEAHVKGLTMLHPGVPEHLRGKFLGISCECVISHLKAMGVTAIELLPIHYHVDEGMIAGRGMTNYWGYNTLGFFAPDVRFATSPDPQTAIFEFKCMVRALHDAGIEVILDVVYNHTCEGNQEGPSFHLKLADCSSYYRLEGGPLNPGGKRYFTDFTGCGNSLNTRNPATLQLVLDSLRYWVQHCHVDGFRFDLASALTRGSEGQIDSFWVDVVNQDPVLIQGVKLIAEPWDCGPNGYLVGQFSTHWAEWNGKFRDSVRAFWNAHCPLSELACRMAGSSDLYRGEAGRHPSSSVNFLCAHDGFTLHDLVTYNDKHNDANGEGNRDGESHNLSWNCGIEGPTFDADILELRARQKRNLFATLAFSVGTPMIRGGDELSQTHKGNNNVYCHDSPLTWVHWDAYFNDDDVGSDDLNHSHADVASSVGIEPLNLESSQQATEFLEFCEQCMRIRQRNLSLQCVSYDLPHRWFNPAGHEMKTEEWNEFHARSIGILVPKNPEDENGDTLLILINAYWEAVSFVIPSAGAVVNAMTLAPAEDGPNSGFRSSRVFETGASNIPKASPSNRQAKAIEGRSPVISFGEHAPPTSGSSLQISSSLSVPTALHGVSRSRKSLPNIRSISPSVFWVRLLDTSNESEIGEQIVPHATLSVPSRCMQVFALQAPKRKAMNRPLGDLLAKYATISQFSHPNGSSESNK
eukprot:ANDGO_00553.mRNA.1 Glycogen operon protein GlgX homolog